MNSTESESARHAGRVVDARGRVVSQVDPVRLHLLHQRSTIPPEALRSMADAILPGARRQRALQVIAVVCGIVVVVGGNIVYFGLFSVWKGLDPVLSAIYAVQAALILSGPVLAFWIAKRQYAARVARVMLQHRYCPHCGYDLRGLPVDAHDGATNCPECGCAWVLAVPTG